MRRNLLISACLCVFALPLLAGCSDDPVAGSADSPAASTSSSAADAAALDLCPLLTLDEVGKVLGGPVTLRAVPGGGCMFNQDDPRAPSINVSTGEPAAAGGGIEASKVGAESQIDGKAQSLSGVGDGAYIVVGKGRVIPTESIQAAGGLVVKGQLLTVVFTQGQGLSADAVTKLITDTVKLLASKAA